MTLEQYFALGSIIINLVFYVPYLYYLATSKQRSKELRFFHLCCMSYLMVSAGVRHSWLALAMWTGWFVFELWQLAKVKVPTPSQNQLLLPANRGELCHNNSCSALLPDNAKYCPQCGDDVSDPRSFTGETTVLRR